MRGKNLHRTPPGALRSSPRRRPSASSGPRGASGGGRRRTGVPRRMMECRSDLDFRAAWRRHRCRPRRRPPALKARPCHTRVAPSSWRVTTNRQRLTSRAMSRRARHTCAVTTSETARWPMAVARAHARIATAASCMKRRSSMSSPALWIRVRRLQRRAHTTRAARQRPRLPLMKRAASVPVSLSTTHPSGLPPSERAYTGSKAGQALWPYDMPSQE